MEVDDFYLNQEEPNRSCFLSLRDLIRNMHPTITESKKYGMPCFSYRKKTVCYLWKDKHNQEPYILFVEGKLLSHPSLESGDRKRMKILRVNPNADFDAQLIVKLIAQCIEWIDTNI